MCRIFKPQSTNMKKVDALLFEEEDAVPYLPWCHYWFINPMSYADGKLRVLPQQHMGTVESAGPGSSRWTSTGAT